MKPTNRPAALLAGGLCLGIAGLLPAVGEVDGPIDLSDFPADYVEEVMVPVPGEILAILEKLGESGWKAEIRPPSKPAFRARIDYALALGVAVADGFVAVQARDKVGVEQAGRSVLRYSKALGLPVAVTRHCQAILDAGEAGDWKAVRAELDRTEVSARAELEKLDDGPIATVVSLGGWVRGTEVATAVISQAFTADKAELLNQPALVKHFVESLRKLDEETRSDPKMIALAKTLEAIAMRMGSEDEPVLSDAVVAMNESCRAAVDLILGQEPPKGEGGSMRGLSSISRILPVVALAAAMGFPYPLRASVAEAYSFAMEAAEAHVKSGFNIRGESWGGQLKAGKRKVIKHQLFRGNEYWFWLGASAPDAGLTLKVYDRKGRPVHVETRKGKYWVAVRVLAPKTGSYLVVVTAPDGGAAADWSLAYGYR